jgi:hypothetical protein
VDEDVLKAGVDPTPFMRPRAERSDGPFECGRVVAADVQRAAEGDRLLDAGPATQLRGQR